MTNQNPIPDDDFIEDYLREPLTQEKKEYLAKLREEWEKGRKEALEHKKNNEYWMFMVADWWEQGCGRTVCLCMTQAAPESRDFDQDGENPYKPINTKEERAIRNFKEVFGEYFTQYIEFITREQFFDKYSVYLPTKLVELKDRLCFIEYHSKLHFNFS